MTAYWSNTILIKQRKSIGYVILQNNALPENRIVMNSNFNQIKNIPPENYSLYIVTGKFYTAEIRDIIIKENIVTCIKTDSAIYAPDNSFVNELITAAMAPKEKVENIDKRPKIRRKFIQYQIVIFILKMKGGLFPERSWT